MWIYFDNNGRIKTQLEHGTPARQGEVGVFNINAYFKNINVNDYPYATIQFSYIDAGEREVDLHILYTLENKYNQKFVKLSSEIDIGEFNENDSYNIYYFSNNDPALFAYYGTYRATITLYGNGVANVTGTIDFEVEKSAGPISDTHISTTQYEQLLIAIGSKINQSSNANIVYGTNNSSPVNQVTIGYTSDKTENTIAYRDENGNLKVGTPTDDDHAVTKIYVDNIEEGLQEDIQANADAIAAEESTRASAVTDLTTRINNLEARGRFLTLWDCKTGLPTDDPAENPYYYKNGDYYIVSNIGSTNYKPTGDYYSGAASTTVETNEVDINDVYVYQGNGQGSGTWKLQINTQKTIGFAQIAGLPTDNNELSIALDSKQDNLNLKVVDYELGD